MGTRGLKSELGTDALTVVRNAVVVTVIAETTRDRADVARSVVIAIKLVGVRGVWAVVTLIRYAIPIRVRRVETQSGDVAGDVPTGITNLNCVVTCIGRDNATDVERGKRFPGNNPNTCRGNKRYSLPG